MMTLASLKILCRIISLNTILISIYHRPNYSTSAAILLKLELLKILSDESKHKIIILCCDFNIDISNDTTTTHRLVNLMCSYGCSLNFTEPTRVTAYSRPSIDKVLSNFLCGLLKTKKFL